MIIELPEAQIWELIVEPDLLGPLAAEAREVLQGGLIEEATERRRRSSASMGLV